LNLALKGLKKLIKEGGLKDVSVEKIKQQYEHNANIVQVAAISVVDKS
jgi:hypothetical protein